MDAGCRDAGDERIAQGGIEVSALRRPGLRTAPVVAALPDPSHHFTVAQPAATDTLAAATIAQPADTVTRNRSRAGTCDSLHNQLHCRWNH